MTKASSLSILPVALAALMASPAMAQSAPAGCVSLRGSKECPAFQDAFVNPQNLSQAWPWFSAVTDVESFDTQFALYWTDPTRFQRSKINIGLQCNRTGAAGATLQYERTVYCGQFTQIGYSAQCNANVEKPHEICQSTCLEYAASQNDIVANPQICAPTNILTPLHNQTRQRTLTNDMTTCTSWTSLSANNTDTCILGSSNEGNCGFGPQVTAQLCQACDPTGNNEVSSCCTASNTDLSQCGQFGHPAAARIQPENTSSSSAPAPSSTSAEAPAESAEVGATSRENGPDLSRGQLAGILVGSLIGALLLGALIAWLLCGRKRKNQDTEASRGAVYGSMAGRASSGDKPWNSEDHMSRRSMAGSPEMEKNGGVGGSHAINMMPLGAGAAAVGGAGLGAAAAGRSNDRAASPTNRPVSEALTSSSGGDKGATVATVRDQYTGQDIHVGEEVVAIYPYNASLNDELTLEPEQHVTILRLYDDGWALGRAADGSEGALPLVCVSSTKGDLPGRRGAGGNGTSTGTSDDEGLTSGNEYTSSVDGAVTAEEGGFTSDGRSQRSRR